jgi:hypothetical protein
MARSITPKVSGFNIELLSPTFILNVRDTNGNVIQNADVIIDCNGEISTGKTDAFGAYAATVFPGPICTLTISTDCYKAFVQRFIAVPIDFTKNFVIKVVDGSDAPIDAANVTIASTIPSSITGQTDANGLFEGVVNTNFDNTITIQKSGLQNIVYTFNSFSPISSLSEDYRIVPVITLEP